MCKAVFPFSLQSLVLILGDQLIRELVDEIEKGTPSAVPSVAPSDAGGLKERLLEIGQIHIVERALVDGLMREL